VKRLGNTEEDFIGYARDARHGELSVRDYMIGDKSLGGRWF
jgi:hypothetical protein